MASFGSIWNPPIPAGIAIELKREEDGFGLAAVSVKLPGSFDCAHSILTALIRVLASALLQDERISQARTKFLDGAIAK